MDVRESIFFFGVHCQLSHETGEECVNDGMPLPVVSLRFPGRFHCSEGPDSPPTGFTPTGPEQRTPKKEKHRYNSYLPAFHEELPAPGGRPDVADSRKWRCPPGGSAKHAFERKRAVMQGPGMVIIDKIQCFPVWPEGPQ